MSYIDTNGPGPAGGAGPAFQQVFSSGVSELTVNHNLGRPVYVQLLDATGRDVVADVQFVTSNQVSVALDVPRALTVLIYG